MTNVRWLSLQDDEGGLDQDVNLATAEMPDIQMQQPQGGRFEDPEAGAATGGGDPAAMPTSVFRKEYGV